jgi:SagB-type dehydrogenase family enzyme
LRASRKKGGRRVTAATLSARLAGHVALKAEPNGKVAAHFYGHSVSLGTFSAAAAHRAKALPQGVSLSSFASRTRGTEKEMALLIQRLVRHGLLEFRLGRSLRGADQVIIEPQVPDYWPRMSPLAATDTLALSRFAYMRRRGSDLVLESPRAGALFRICDPKLVAFLAMLATPQPLKKLQQSRGSAGIELLALLIGCNILFKVGAAQGGRGLRPSEGNDSLVLWDFHDLLFHARSTEGRHANPLGGVYPYATSIAPLPAVRPRWSGTKVDLAKLTIPDTEAAASVAKILHARRSVRSFDDRAPITLNEVSRFLDATARVRSEWTAAPDDGGDAPAITHTVRPYPSGGGSYPLELYLAVDKCEGLDRGFYFYDAREHALVSIKIRAPELEALFRSAAFAMGEADVPQVMITIAARFGRVSWKYSSIAYSLILKDVGVLTQTFYLMATAMGLGGCAIGSINIDLFARISGIDFYVEGPVGQFAIGRGSASAS